MEHEVISPTLSAKLAAIVEYVDDRRLGKRTSDPAGMRALLDDAEVAGWLATKKRAGIPRRFAGRDNGGW